MSPTARFIVRNLDGFVRDLEEADANRRRAAHLAVRVEANRLRLLMKKEIMEGAPGGWKFAPLSVIHSFWRRNVTPLARLAVPVRYWADKIGKTGQWSAAVGFSPETVTKISGDFARVKYSGPEGRGSRYRKDRMSASWLKIARLQQEGFDEPVSGSDRKFLRRIGGDLIKRGRKKEARVFFLRPSTTVFHIPARPIVAPFWQAHQDDAGRNIESNFNRRMAGDRI